MNIFRTNPAFRATGKGYYNKLPDFPATAKNANGHMVNTGLHKNDRNADIWLFVTNVETGWQVSGETAQTALSRTWYPRNLSQMPLTISGIVANQFEYDRLVEFVTAHMRRAVDPRSTDNIGTRAIRFSLKDYKVQDGKDRRGHPTYRYIHRGMLLEGNVKGIQAGHERFVNAPTWSMELEVSNDFLDQPAHTKGEMNKLLYQSWLSGFGKTIKGASGSNTLSGEPLPAPDLTTDSAGSNWHDEAFGDGTGIDLGQHK